MMNDFGKRYGVWNNVKKEFQFGINEGSKKRALTKLIDKVGKDSYKWRFEIREIKQGMKIQSKGEIR